MGALDVLPDNHREREVELLNLTAFHQALSQVSLWTCMQGLIKGASFGVVVALAGCLRGMRCGRSASAVGEAATTAVVTAIVWIVVTDAVWTFIFMVT